MTSMQQDVKLTRIGVLSSGIVLGLIYSVIGLFFVIFFGVAGGVATLFGGFGFGIAAFILLPIIYGLLGAVGGMVGALLYNLVAKYTGGIELEFRNLQTRV